MQIFINKKIFQNKLYSQFLIHLQRMIFVKQKLIINLFVKMNLSAMQPKTYSPQKFNTIRSEIQPTTIKKQFNTYTVSPQKPLNYSIVSQQEDDLLKLRSEILGREQDLKYAELIEHNNSLQAQLDRAQKAAQQRKSESEMWKQKYEAQMGQIMQIKQNYESEIKALSQEISKVNARITSSEMDKNRTLSDNRHLSDSQNQQMQEHFKRSNQLQSEMYENQIQKLRELLDDKSAQLAQLQSQLERQKNESSDQQIRLMNEIEQLKVRLSAIQLDHQAEQQALKNKLELYKESHLRNAQVAHENQQDILINEISKLKNLLEIKNEEIEQLINQNQKQKSQYDIEAMSLRDDIELLKRQLLNNEQMHQQENHNIQTNLENIHNNEATNLKLSHENQVQALNREILKLKEILDMKNHEIEKQMIEKQQQKDYYDGEVHRLMSTIEDQKRKIALIEAEKNREINDLKERINRLNLQNEAIQIDLQKQIQLLNGELDNLKQLIEHKNNEITSNLNQYSKIKLDLEDRIKNLQNDLELNKLKAFEAEKARLQEIGELRQIIKEQDVLYKEKIRQLEQQNEHQKYEINKALDLFNNKSRECENLILQRNNIDQVSKKLQDENDRLLEKLQLFEREKNLEIDELRQKMDSGAAYQFENLKSAYNTQVGILSDQISDLNNQLQLKSKDNTELLEKYTILDKNLIPDSLVHRNSYNSRTGVPAEYIANKAIHEATLKSQLRNSSIQRY
ncbi:hypothetical protein pb186bvf_006938 [Paramecium bursaria]